MVLIADRPAEIEDRAVPGHWEGDLMLGARGQSAIATLVERQTRYVMLLAVGRNKTSHHVCALIAKKIRTLPQHLAVSLTWDRGKEMARHRQFSIATGVHVYFCDPSSPWQRGSNENTNGLLRQYFPRGSDLSVHSQRHLNRVAHVLNDRPRQTLGWMKPSEKLKRFSDSPCTAWARRGTSACTNAGGPMQAYSMDLRERALLDSDAGMKAADVAVKYRVSGSWVRLLKQRRRETGEVAPRVQRHGRRRMLEPHLHTLAALIAEQPDRTLAELKDALGTPASLATIWRAVAALDVTVKKNGPALRTRST